MLINISIDDISPHPKMGLDCLRNLDSLLNKFPNIKISLFVPTSICRYKFGEKKYCLLDYPKFVEEIKKLPNNFEICYHGHFHGNKVKKSNNDEFRYLDATKTQELLNTSYKIFKETGISVKNVFRPPGFWMSQWAFEGCKNFGIKTLALNRDKRYRKCYNRQHKSFNNVVWVGKNTDYIEMFFHAGKDQRNYIGKESVKIIMNTINNYKDIEFVFLEQLNGKN